MGTTGAVFVSGENWWRRESLLVRFGVAVYGNIHIFPRYILSKGNDMLITEDISENKKTVKQI